MKVPSLFGGEVDIDPNPRRGGAPKKKGLYAGIAGSGPAEETCRTCEHRYYHERGRFSKCLLMQHHWTHGYGTDIKVRTPACDKWDGVKAEVVEPVPVEEVDIPDFLKTLDQMQGTK